MNAVYNYMALSEECLNEAGPFSKKDATWLNELFQLRQTGEYEADEELSEEDALKAVEIATEFILQVEAYLRTTGLTT